MMGAGGVVEPHRGAEPHMGGGSCAWRRHNFRIARETFVGCWLAARFGC